MFWIFDEIENERDEDRKDRDTAGSSKISFKVRPAETWSMKEWYRRSLASTRSLSQGSLVFTRPSLGTRLADLLSFPCQHTVSRDRAVIRTDSIWDTARENPSLTVNTRASVSARESIAILRERDCKREQYLRSLSARDCNAGSMARELSCRTEPWRAICILHASHSLSRAYMLPYRWRMIAIPGLDIWNENQGIPAVTPLSLARWKLKVEMRAISQVHTCQW